MLKYIIIFVCTCFTVFIFVSQSVSMLKNQQIRMINIFSVTYGVVYGLLPILYFVWHFCFGWNEELMGNTIDFSIDGLFNLLFWIASSILMYMFIQISYGFNKGEGRRGNNNLLIVTHTENDYKQIQILVVLTTVIGLVCMYLWSRAYGGIYALIEVGNKVRGGTYKLLNKLAFFKHPSKLLILSTYLTIVLVRHKKHVLFNLFIFALSFYYAILFLLANDGRMTTVCFLLIVLFLWSDFFNNKQSIKKKFVYLFLLIIVSGVLVSNLDSITFYIRNGKVSKAGNKRSLIEEVLYGYAYIIISSQSAVEHLCDISHIWLLLNELLSGCLAWIPTSFKPKWLINIWSYNTNLVFNSEKWSGQLPCDLVTESIYNMGVLGFLWGCFIGFIIRKLDLKYERGNSLFFNCIYCVFILEGFRWVTSFMLYDIILNLFYIAIAYVILKFIKLIV